MKDLEVILSAIPDSHRLYSKIYKLMSLRHGFYRYLRLDDGCVKALYKLIWMKYKERLFPAFSFDTKLLMNDYDRHLIYLLKRLKCIRRGRPKKAEGFVKRVVSRKHSWQRRRANAWHDREFYGDEVDLNIAEGKGLFDHMQERYEIHGVDGLKESFSENDVKEFLDYMGVKNED